MQPVTNPIADFLKTYDRPQSQKTRSSAIRRFLCYIYPELPAPDPSARIDLPLFEPPAARFIKEVKAGKRSPVNELSGFMNSLGEMSPRGQHSYLSGAITFLEHHGIELSPAERKRIRRRAPKQVTVTEEEVLTREGIIRILNYSPVQMKALIMVMCSSGIRLGEALGITVDDVDLQGDPVALHIPKKIAKNKLPRTTYITSETAKVLREWMAYRAEYLEKKRGRPEYRTPLDDPRVFPFNDSAGTDMFILACQKAKLHHTDRNTGKSTIRLHSCRKWFRSNLVKAGGNALDVTEKLMGHAGYLATSYVRLTEAEIQTFYRENEHYLYIYPGTSDADRENLKSVTEENAKLRKEMEELKLYSGMVYEIIKNRDAFIEALEMIQSRTKLTT